MIREWMRIVVVCISISGLYRSHSTASLRRVTIARSTSIYTAWTRQHTYLRRTNTSSRTKQHARHPTSSASPFEYKIQHHHRGNDQTHISGVREFVICLERTRSTANIRCVTIPEPHRTSQSSKRPNAYFRRPNSSSASKQHARHPTSAV